MVYVLMVTYPYEGTKVLGVFSDFDTALAHRGSAEDTDTSDGYNDFEVREFEIDAPLPNAK